MMSWTRRKLRELRSGLIHGLKPALYYAIGGGRATLSSSGVTVTPDAAMKVAAWKRGVCLVADYIGKTPFHVKEGKRKAKDHPAWRLVRRWSMYHAQSAFEFRRTMIIIAMGYGGNAYARIVRDPKTMAPTALRIMDPSKVEPCIVRGQLRYRIKGQSNTMAAVNVMHIKAPSKNGFTGMDPIKEYAGEVLGLAIAQQQYASRYYENGGVPSTYLKSEIPLGDDQWNRLKGESGPLKNSVDNPHEIPVLEQADLKTLNLSAQETELLGAREFSLKDIANIIGIGVHKLQGDGKSSYKSLEEENRAFREDTLDPWLCQFEMEYQKLLTEDEQANDTHDIEAVRDSLTRTNIKDRQEYLSKAVGGPWMAANEGRDIEGLPPKKGGDDLLAPLNMIPPDDEDGGPDDDSDSDDDNTESKDDERSRVAPDALQTVNQLRALTDVYSRMAKRLATQARKAGAKSKAFPEFLEGFEDRNRDTLRAAFDPICGLIGSRRGDTVADGLLTGFRDQLQTLYDSTPAEAFTERVDAVADEFETSARSRAETQLMDWLT